MGGALNKIEDTPEMAQAMINPQTHSHLYVFNGNETQSPNTLTPGAGETMQRHHRVLHD